VRRKGQGRGLSSAVLLGFQMAKHPNVLCMDADLQVLAKIEAVEFEYSKRTLRSAFSRLLYLYCLRGLFLSVSTSLLEFHVRFFLFIGNTSMSTLMHTARARSCAVGGRTRPQRIGGIYRGEPKH